MQDSTRKRLLLHAAAVASLAFITWVDWTTGYELGLFVFYFVPVSLAAWWGSRRAGVGFALAAGGCWFLADRLAQAPYSSPAYLYWETTMRLVSYLVIALSLSKIRTVLRRQQDLLRVVSHDLRSPLSALAGQAQLLAARAEPGSWVAGRAEAIQRASGHMASMIEDLVDGARFESGRLRLDLRPVELGPFLSDLVGRMSPEVPPGRLELSVPPERVAARADPARLERIVVNLLSNAVRYSAGAGPVRLEVRRAGARVVLAVIDHGPGIAPEDRPHLFERYHRGRASTGTEGLGLGLHSAKLLVRAHRGRIRVEESSGGGATFLVELLPSEPPGPEPGQAAGRQPLAVPRG